MSSKHWILISIALLVLSSFPYKNFNDDKRAAVAREATAKRNLSTAQNNVRDIQNMFAQASFQGTLAARPVIEIFKEFSYGAKIIAGLHRINIDSIRPTSGGRSNRNLEELATPLQNATSIKVITLEVSGTYTDYRDLKEFINFLREQNIAIGSLEITKNTYKLQVDIFGT